MKLSRWLGCAALVAAVGCGATVVGCSGDDQGGGGGDGGTDAAPDGHALPDGGTDATSDVVEVPDSGHPDGGAPDAQPDARGDASDGGSDGGIDAAPDAEVDAADAGPRQDGGGNDDGGGTDASDGGNACAAMLAQMLAAPMMPPNQYAGLDHTKGKDARGLTVDEANAAGCIAFDAATDPPSFPGYREAHWGGKDDVMVEYNLESRVLYQIVLGKNTTGTISFHSRAGGSFGDHTYVMGIGSVKRDGAAFAIDWSDAQHRAINELYDAMIATFSPSTPAGVDCVKEATCLFIADDGAGSSYLGVRPIHFYSIFDQGTTTPYTFYGFFPSAAADCTTPNANRERMIYAPIAPAWASGIGGLQMSKVGASKAGMTYQEADAIECNGAMTPPPDDGYGAIQWGPGNEVLLEFNTSSSVGYELFAKPGYKGTLSGGSIDGKHLYEIGLGSITKDGAPFTIDWSAPNASVTELANAVDYYWGGLTQDDADCVAANDCTIVPDDGKGNAVITFPLLPIAVVSPKGTSAPSSIYATWDGGK